MKKKFAHCQADDYAHAFVEEIIMRTAPGSRLPGMREMISRSGLGRIRLERALKKFEQTGLISVHDRSGRYRQGDPDNVPVVFIHFSPYPVVEKKDDFLGGIIASLRHAVSTNSQELAIINARDMQSEQLYSILNRRHIKQAFIFGSGDLTLTGMIRSLVPYTVSLLPRHTVKLGSELRDSPDMTSIQLKYLFQANCRRIGYIHNVEENWTQSPVQLHRLLDYYRIMAEQGLKIEPEWVFYCGYNWEHFNNSMYKLLKSPRQPEALIVPGSALQNLYKFCANNGITIGKELAVMACDDIAPDLRPRATTVTNGPREIGEQAWQVMEQCLRGVEECRFTKLNIITGETVLHRK